MLQFTDTFPPTGLMNTSLLDDLDDVKISDIHALLRRVTCRALMPSSDGVVNTNARPELVTYDEPNHRGVPRIPLGDWTGYYVMNHDFSFHERPVYAYITSRVADLIINLNTMETRIRVSMAYRRRTIGEDTPSEWKRISNADTVIQIDAADLEQQITTYL